MVFSNLKVRLESLSTTSRQVITTPIPSGGFWPALSIASVLTAVCHTHRERSPNLTQLHAKFTALGFTASELPVIACPSLLLRKVAYVRFAVTPPSSCSFFRSSIECTRKRLQPRRFSPSTAHQIFSRSCRTGTSEHPDQICNHHAQYYVRRASACVGSGWSRTGDSAGSLL